MRLGAATNLRVEAASGCLFLIFVLLVGLMGLLAANWVATELWEQAAGPVTDRILLGPRVFLTGFSMLLIPIAVLGLAIVGIRILLVCPEPPPWLDEAEGPFSELSQ